MTEDLNYNLKWAIEVAQWAATLKGNATAVVLLPKFGWAPVVEMDPTELTTPIDGFFVTADGPIRDDLPSF